MEAKMAKVLIRVDGQYEYTIPEENLVTFAQYEAMQRYQSMTDLSKLRPLTNIAEAISYLLSLGLEVEYV